MLRPQQRSPRKNVKKRGVIVRAKAGHAATVMADVTAAVAIAIVANVASAAPKANVPNAAGVVSVVSVRIAVSALSVASSNARRKPPSAAVKMPLRQNKPLPPRH